MPKKTGAVKWLDRNGKALHAEGLTDKQIAKKAKCVGSVVCYWRKQHNLKPNAKSGSGEWHACLKKNIDKRVQTLALVEEGLTDREAADRLGILIGTFRERRRRMELDFGRRQVAPHKKKKGPQ